MSTLRIAKDRTRQVVVTFSMALCLVGTMIGVGVFGGPRVQEAAGGALAADATLIAPAVPAFSIWTPIYLGLVAYTVWQWLPAQKQDQRHRSVGGLVAASMVLNALWLLVTGQGWLWASLVIMTGLVWVLGTLVAELEERPSFGGPETIITDGTFGLYLGWVCVAACANATATLVDSGLNPGGITAEISAILLLAIAAGIGVYLTRRLGGRWAIAVALAWGLAWVAVGRLAGEPHSAVVGLTALAAAIVVVSATAKCRLALAATD